MEQARMLREEMFASPIAEWQALAWLIQICCAVKQASGTPVARSTASTRSRRLRGPTRGEALQAWSSGLVLDQSEGIRSPCNNPFVTLRLSHGAPEPSRISSGRSWDPKSCLRSILLLHEHTLVRRPGKPLTVTTEEDLESGPWVSES